MSCAIKLTKPADSSVRMSVSTVLIPYLHVSSVSGVLQDFCQGSTELPVLFYDLSTFYILKGNAKLVTIMVDISMLPYH